MSFACSSCVRKFETVDNIQRPTKETFDEYLPFFLKDLPYAQCAKAGRPAYSQVIIAVLLYFYCSFFCTFIVLLLHYFCCFSKYFMNTTRSYIIFCYPQAIKYEVGPKGNLTIDSTYFMSYHTSLSKSVDFYSSLKQARVVTDEVQTVLREKGYDVSIFPYRLILFLNDFLHI